MLRSSVIPTLAACVIALVLGRASFAGEAPSTPPPSAGEPAAAPGTPSDKPARRAPENAAAALIRAAAAYEYGDLNQMVEATRPITEGFLAATVEEQSEAFRLLGIGLFLTDRPAGAERAFTELLRMMPQARLDPTTTRPELVAFFENVRRQQMKRALSSRKYAYNFLPPLGQFQNGDRITGWTLLGLEGTALLTAVTCKILVDGVWRNPDKTVAGSGVSFETANAVRTTYFISLAAFAAVYLYGVIDGMVGYDRPTAARPLAFKLRPVGNGVGFTF